MRIYFIILCVLVFAGCSRELPLPGSDRTGKIVLIGELVAEDSISIRGGGSAPIAAGSTVSPPDGLVLTVNDGEGQTWTVPGVRDELSSDLHTVVLNVATRVQSGKRYTLSAKHEKMGEATVSATVPQPFSATVTDTARTFRGGTAYFRVSIRIDDVPGDSYYVIEAVKQPMDVIKQFFYNGSWRQVRYYRQQYDSLKGAGVPFAERADTVLGKRPSRIFVNSADPNTENLQDGSGGATSYRRILLSDRTFAGGSYNTTVEIDSWAFVSFLPEDRGRILFQIKSVSKEYFEFLTSYERQAPSASGDVSSLKGNVVGGFGAVGGVVKKQWVYLFDTWE